MGDGTDTPTGRNPGHDPERLRDRERIAELERQVAELEALYRATPVAFCVVDCELRYLRVNDEYADIVAFRTDEIIGRRMDEIVNERARDLAVGLVKSTIATGQPLRNLELPGVTREDAPEERVWLVNAHPVKSDGEVTAVIGVMQNVTELKQMERAARERLEVIDSLYRNAPIGLAFMGRDLRFARVNEVVAEINGIPVEAHIGKTLEEVNPTLGPNPEKMLRELMTQRRSVRDVEAEVEVPSDPGVPHVYRLSIEPLSAEDGSPLGLLGTVLDVTEQARAERELKAAHVRITDQLRELETLYEHAPIGICQVDRELRIVRASRALARTHGLSLEEIHGRSLVELNPGIAPQANAAFQRVLETGQRQMNVEVRGAPPASPGAEYTWLLNLHPTFASAGRVDGMIVVAQNVTPLTRQQDELQQLKARLDEAQRITGTGSWEWDMVSDTLWWSDELYQVMGKSPERFDPSWNNFVELVHADDRSKVRGQLQAALDRDETHWLECRVVLDDSSEHTLRSSARLERADDGHPVRLIGTCQRLTTRNQALAGKRRRSSHDRTG